MKVSDFRKDLSKHLDTALKEPVYIERGGITFVLVSNIAPKGNTLKAMTEKVHEIIHPTTTEDKLAKMAAAEKNKSGADAPKKDYDFCKHGNVRSFCKQGCK